MDDLISRKAALDALYKMLHDCFWADDKELDAVIMTLNDMPSAQPERKKGFWEYVDDVDYRCSVCHKYAYGCLGEVLSGHYKYCPYCGCAMEGEEDDGEEIH